MGGDSVYLGDVDYQEMFKISKALMKAIQEAIKAMQKKRAQVAKKLWQQIPHQFCLMHYMCSSIRTRNPKRKGSEDGYRSIC
jgi:hypothetical protein